MRLKLRQCLLLFLTLAGLVAAQSTGPVTLADISGDGAAHQITTLHTTARWITFVSLPSNSTTSCGTSAVTGCVRVGDANISTSRGVVIQVGQAYSLYEPTSTYRHDLSTWYYLVQSGDKISITYGQ